MTLQNFDEPKSIGQRSLEGSFNLRGSKEANFNVELGDSDDINESHSPIAGDPAIMLCCSEGDDLGDEPTHSDMLCEAAPFINDFSTNRHDEN